MQWNIMKNISQNYQMNNNKRFNHFIVKKFYVLYDFVIYLKLSNFLHFHNEKMKKNLIIFSYLYIRNTLILS